MTSVWNYPTRIVFGVGEAARCGQEAHALGMRRVLIVSDAGVENAGLLNGIRQSLQRAEIAAAEFARVEPNPTEENIAAAVEAFRSHDADGIVAIGGGSPLDAGKLVAVRARTDRSWEELDDAKGGDRYIPADVPPIVSLPTTAGTGSEVGRSGVLTLRSTGRKTVVFSPYLLPRVAILDPELTRGLPPGTTAATGFDALTHCIEAYLAKGDHPMADAIALAGIDLVARNLARAVARGDDLLARGNMMKAAMMGAVAFQKGLGACHSLAHPLSSDHGLHHGLANALCLPAVMTFNEAATPDRVQHVNVLLGGGQGQGACAARLREFRSELDLPNGLSAVGIEERHLPALADKAIEDACHTGNPRACTRDDLLALYRAAL